MLNLYLYINSHVLLEISILEQPILSFSIIHLHLELQNGGAFG
jgi:hypothetical protein